VSLVLCLWLRFLAQARECLLRMPSESRMTEIGKSGSMSGERKRSVVPSATGTAPLSNSSSVGAILPLTRFGREFSLKRKNSAMSAYKAPIFTDQNPARAALASVCWSNGRVCVRYGARL